MIRKSKVMREKSIRTRERILEASEQLFAAKGFTEASMRDITSAAKVNLSVAYYYFKDKEALLVAVFERYVRPLMDKQLEMLAQAREAAGTDPIPVRKLLDALILPRLDGVPETIHRLLMMLFVRRGSFEQKVFMLLEQETAEVRQKFFEEFQKTLSVLSAVELRFRMESVEAMIAGWRAITPFKKGTYPKEITPGAYLEMFITMVSEIFNAPPSLSSAK